MNGFWHKKKKKEKIDINKYYTFVERTLLIFQDYEKETDERFLA